MIIKNEGEALLTSLPMFTRSSHGKDFSQQTSDDFSWLKPLSAHSYDSQFSKNMM